MKPLDTSEVAKLLAEYGRRRSLAGGNPYRSKAYLRAAESLAVLAEPLDRIVAEGRLQRVVSLLFRGTAATLAGMLARAPKAEKSDRRLSYAPADNCISRGVENSGKSVARRSLLPPNAIYII